MRGAISGFARAGPGAPPGRSRFSAGLACGEALGDAALFLSTRPRRAATTSTVRRTNSRARTRAGFPHRRDGLACRDQRGQLDGLGIVVRISEPIRSLSGVTIFARAV